MKMVQTPGTALLLLQLLLLACAIEPCFSWIQSGTSSYLASKSNVPQNVHLLILPGFGNESADYILEQAPVGSLTRSLQKRGWKDEQIRVLPLKRTDWLQVFLRGAVSLDFWRNQAPPAVAFGWYLDRVAEQVKDLVATDKDAKIVLVCHSAGGWLARAALGFGSASYVSDKKETPSFCIDLDRIIGMVTLGAPHEPPPPQVMDMTRGALRITHSEFPGAFHTPRLFYVTVIGNAVAGVKREGNEKNTVAGFAYNSYEAVCGDGTTVGDGVVPVCAGHLKGANQINLEGVLHSINAPDNWYGSDSIIDSWHDTMLDQIQKMTYFDAGPPLERFFR